MPRSTLPPHLRPLLLLLAVLAVPSVLRGADDAPSKRELREKVVECKRALDEALTRHSKSSWEVQRARIAFGDAWVDLGEPKKALEPYAAAEAALGAREAPESRRVVNLRCKIARALADSGKREKAVEFLDSRVEGVAENRGQGMSAAEKENLASAQYAFAYHYHGLGAYAQSQEHFEGALAMYRDLRGEKDPSALGAANGVAACQIERGQYAEGRKSLEAILEILGEDPEANAVAIRTARGNVGICLLESGKLEEALAIFTANIAAHDADSVPRGDPTRIGQVENRLTTLARLERWDEAIEELDAHLELLKSLRPKSAWRDSIDAWKEDRREWRRAARESREKDEEVGDESDSAGSDDEARRDRNDGDGRAIASVPLSPRAEEGVRP